MSFTPRDLIEFAHSCLLHCHNISMYSLIFNAHRTTVSSVVKNINQFTEIIRKDLSEAKIKGFGSYCRSPLNKLKSFRGTLTVLFDDFLIIWKLICFKWELPALSSQTARP